MSRETIARHQLDALVRARMQTLGTCRDVAVTITGDDSRCTGPNWRAATAAREGAGVDREACSQALQPYLRELADRYDIPQRAASSDEMAGWAKQIPSHGCAAQPMGKPIPPHVVDSLLDAKFVTLVDGALVRTARGDQVAAG